MLYEPHQLPNKPSVLPDMFLKVAPCEKTIDGINERNTMQRQLEISGHIFSHILYEKKKKQSLQSSLTKLLFTRKIHIS
jgi:hypothetical protein